MKFSGFPSKGAKEGKEWGWVRRENLKKKKKWWGSVRVYQEVYIILKLKISVFIITIS